MNDEKLIPDLKEWRKFNGNEFSIEDWITSEGNIKLAIAYSKFFWPDFIEYKGCIFLKSHFNLKNFENWEKAEYIKNYAQIENVLNHIHILDLFGTDEKQSEINYEQIIFLGNKMCEIYTAKLKNEFPDKEFIVTFNNEQILDKEDFIDYEISFYQKNNLNKPLKKYGR